MSDPKANKDLTVGDSELDCVHFLSLLKDLIAETKDHLVNLPPKQVPQERFAAAHVLKALEPHTKEGGPLKVQSVEQAEGRTNLIITYKAAVQTDKVISFVGAHFDVVPIASPEVWKHDPYQLTVEGDKLYGRGTTDCLGHVALLTEMFLFLARNKPKLNVSVVGVMIADEEVGEDANIGVNGVAKKGLLDFIKTGPLYWLDCADKMPAIGTGGSLAWRMTAHGIAGHSGYPHKAINAIELLTEGTQYVQKRFYQDYGTHPREAEYKFMSSSSFKPTLMKATPGALNQIKNKASMEGDVRLVPFHDFNDVMKSVKSYVNDFNSLEVDRICHPKNAKSDRAAAFRALHGPNSTFVLTEGGDEAKDAKDDDNDDKDKEDAGTRKAVQRGKLELEWLGDGCNGLACDLESAGYKALVKWTEKVLGVPVETIADTGTLPLVAELSEQGFDVQCIGYGVEDAYHMDNEWANLSDFQQGYKILMNVVQDISDMNAM